MLVTIFTRNKEHHIDRNRKKGKCKLDNLLVISDKNISQCTVGNRSVVCTIHHFAYTKKDKNLNTHHFSGLE